MAHYPCYRFDSDDPEININERKSAMNLYIVKEDKYATKEQKRLRLRQGFEALITGALIILLYPFGYSSVYNIQKSRERIRESVTKKENGNA